MKSTGSLPGNRRRKQQRGSTVLECALTLPLFVCLLVGVVDVGQFLFLHATIGERVRSALRYGTVAELDPAKVQNVVLYGTPTEGTQAAFGLTRNMVQVSRAGNGTVADRLIVTVKDYEFTLLTPWVAGKAKGRPITGSIPYEHALF